MIHLGSVNLTVRDIRQAENFYVDVLGLAVDAERANRPSFVMLRAANCMVILQEDPEMPPGQAPIELAFETDDVSAMKVRLGGGAIVQSMGWGNAIETEDPEGRRLNLYRLT